jgi:hypothetical protein
MTLQKEIDLGDAAQRLLDDPLLKDVFVRLREEYIRKWEAATARDVDGRERLWWAVRVVNEVQTDLSNIVSNGRLARAQVDQT